MYICTSENQYYIIYKLFQGIFNSLSPIQSEGLSLVWPEAQSALPGHIQGQDSQTHIPVI